VLIEVCQATLTANRVGEPMDVIADALGIVVARVIVGWLGRAPRAA
jgi:hypothetical protein